MGARGVYWLFWLVKSSEGLCAELRFLNWCYVGADVVSPVTYQPWKQREREKKKSSKKKKTCASSKNELRQVTRVRFS